jgi:hypothetical protein
MVVWLVVEESSGDVNIGTLGAVVSTISDHVDAHAE